jgi:pimeloyl-ACP methyl ester carboxylesterase
LLDALTVKRVIVLGVSAGAPSAVQLALRHPDRVAALVLLSPLGYAPDSLAPLPSGKAVTWLTHRGVDFIYWTMLHLNPSTLTRLLGVSPRLLEKAGPDDQRWVSQLLHSVIPLSMRVAGVTNDMSMRLSLRSDRWPLERVAAPTLIVASSDDPFHTQPAAEYAAEHIPAAMLVVYPTGGHLFIGHLADVRRTVAFFLRQSLRGHPMSAGS